MKHTFNLIEQIRKEYEEMREEHNRAVAENGEHLNCSCRADWDERMRNYQLIHRMVSKLAK